MRHRLLALVLAVVLLVPFGPVSSATPPDAYTCLHPDVAVSAGGEVLSKGDEIAFDGGMAHAGTGLTFSFQARTFNPTIDLCNLKITDARTWQVSHWPCDNQDLSDWQSPTGSVEALGLVDFGIFPHLDNPNMPEFGLADAERWAAALDVPGYAIDDQTAITVIDGGVAVVSEGHWKLFD